MQIGKFADATTRDAHVGLIRDGLVHALNGHTNGGLLARILESESPEAHVESLLSTDVVPVPLGTVTWLPPIDQQEVWAAGVTYTRSKSARMEESEAAASCYDRVYVSARPELFLKATPYRVVGHEQSVRIRTDSQWNVPEPELTVVLNSNLEIVGFTIGNDVSSRDIEGENPLYLPQAKVYNQSCSLGPWITLSSGMPSNLSNTRIGLRVIRNQQTVYEGETNVGQMARSVEELVQWLGRDNDFPNGAFLMTGTGIVPDSDFTMLANDIVDIEIDHIGTLTNSVVQG